MLTREFKLDAQQSCALQLALEGHSFAIVGTAGTGKMHIIHRITEAIKQNGRRVAVTAATALAATNLHLMQATTLHQFFGIQDGRYSLFDLRDRVVHDEAWESTKEQVASSNTLIIDEASMASACILDQVECVSQFGRDDRKLFGGLQVIIVLDPRQLPPAPIHSMGMIANTALRAQYGEQSFATSSVLNNYIVKRTGS